MKLKASKHDRMAKLLVEAGREKSGDKSFESVVSLLGEGISA